MYTTPEAHHIPWFVNLFLTKWLLKNVYVYSRTSLVAQMVKRLSALRETQVRSLGRENPLEKEMAVHSSTIAWKIPWIEEPGRLQSMGSQRVGHDWVTSLSLSFKKLYFINKLKHLFFSLYLAHPGIVNQEFPITLSDELGRLSHKQVQKSQGILETLRKGGLHC